MEIKKFCNSIKDKFEEILKQEGKPKFIFVDKDCGFFIKDFFDKAQKQDSDKLFIFEDPFYETWRLSIRKKYLLHEPNENKEIKYIIDDNLLNNTEKKLTINTLNFPQIIFITNNIFIEDFKCGETTDDPSVILQLPFWGGQFDNIERFETASKEDILKFKEKNDKNIPSEVLDLMKNKHQIENANIYRESCIDENIEYSNDFIKIIEPLIEARELKTAFHLIFKRQKENICRDIVYSLIKEKVITKYLEDRKKKDPIKKVEELNSDDIFQRNYIVRYTNILYQIFKFLLWDNINYYQTINYKKAILIDRDISFLFKDLFSPELNSELFAYYYIEIKKENKEKEIKNFKNNGYDVLFVDSSGTKMDMQKQLKNNKKK